MKLFKVFIIITFFALLAIPQVAAAQGGAVEASGVHTANTAGNMPSADEDQFLFKGYRGPSCPYHMKLTCKTYVEDISKQEEKGQQIKYRIRLDIKNDSPCLYADVNLRIKMVNLDGSYRGESTQTLDYIPSYSSNVFYNEFWLPIYVNPKELNFDFEYEPMPE